MANPHRERRLVAPPDAAAADNLAGDGQHFAIFDDGHHRQLPRPTGGPFRYRTFAADLLEQSAPYATKPLKQAAIAPSLLYLLYLLYPLIGELEGYSREQYIPVDQPDQLAGGRVRAGRPAAGRVSPSSPAAQLRW